MNCRLLLLIIILVASSLASATASAQSRQRTTRPKGSRAAQGIELLAADTLAAARLDSVSLAGYDKPLRSRRESLFVTNSTTVRLVRLWLRITYRDESGRQLHERTVEVGADIPAGATRLVTFASWDRQLTFVYSGSEQPRRARAIPYSVDIALLRATVGPD